MNKTQLNELNMYTNLKDLFQVNKFVWVDNKDISHVIKKMNYHLGALINYNTFPSKIQVENYDREVKLKIHLEMITAATHITNIGKEYARNIGNQQLFFELNSIKNKIILSKNTDSSYICRRIQEIIHPFFANTADYKAISTSLLNLKHLISTYNSLNYCPNFEQKIKAKATPIVISHFKSISQLLKKELDVLITSFQNENPIFYNQYKTTRVVNNIGQRLTATIKGYIYDNNYDVLSGTTINLTSKQGFNKTISIDNLYRFTRLYPTDYLLTVSAVGFIPQTKSVTITKNMTLHVDFILKAYPEENMTVLSTNRVLPVNNVIIKT